MRRLPVVAMAMTVALAGGVLPVHATEPAAKGWPDTVDLKLTDPRAMVYSPDHKRMLVSASVGGIDGGRIIVLDAATGKELSRVKVGDYGELHLSPRGDRLIMTHPRGTTLLDPVTGAMLGQGPSGVFDLAFSADGSRFFTTDSYAGTITAYDSATLAVMAQANLGKSALGIAANSAGDRLYVAVIATTDTDPILAVALDATTLQPLARSSVAVDPRCISASPSGDRVYVQTTNEFGIAGVSVLDPTSLAVFATDTVARRIDCPAVSPDGSRLYAYIAGGGKAEYGPIAVIDAATMKTVGSIATPLEASILGFSPDGRSMWLGVGYALLRKDLSKVSGAPPGVDWFGDNAGYAALPAVQVVEARFTKLLAGPFIAAQWDTDADSDTWYWDWTVVGRDGVIRRQDSRTVTYTSSTEVCTRKVSKKLPASPLPPRE